MKRVARSKRYDFDKQEGIPTEIDWVSHERVKRRLLPPKFELRSITDASMRKIEQEEIQKSYLKKEIDFHIQNRTDIQEDLERG